MADRNEQYAQALASMIRIKTISYQNQTDFSCFDEFHELLHQKFPLLFQTCEVEDFSGSLLLRWQGKATGSSALFMNHHDVVEAEGTWEHAPFSGEIVDGKIWGRGTLDTKGGLFCMLQAAEELIAAGFVPQRDIYFESACTEEINGVGADTISQTLQERGIRFDFTLDEGGMMVYDPVGGADGTFAMIGVGEKGTADIKFVAHSTGGHASTPGKNTPLVRLAKFMVAVEKSHIFKCELSPVVREMFARMSLKMHGPLKVVLGHPNLFAPLLKRVMPAVSPAAGAMLQTTLAFTMASGSEAVNVLPQEAYVMGNMRFSHHQGAKDSFAAVKKLADRYGVEMIVMKPGFESDISDYHGEPFRRVEAAVKKLFPDVIPTPFITNAASDSRFMNRLSDQCIRFVPFRVSNEQLASVHGLNENVDISCLAPAVDFYKLLMEEC